MLIEKGGIVLGLNQEDLEKISAMNSSKIVDIEIYWGTDGDSKGSRFYNNYSGVTVKIDKNPEGKKLELVINDGEECIFRRSIEEINKVLCS